MTRTGEASDHGALARGDPPGEAAPDEQRPVRAAPLVERSLPLLYLAFALPTVLLLTVRVPPFQNPDELAHVFRAEQVARGTFVAHRSGTTSGGLVDANLPRAAEPFAGIPFHRERKVSRDALERAGLLRWSGEAVEARFANTAAYPPFLYLPQAAGIGAGKAAGLSILESLRLARALNGLASIALGFVAIALAARGRALLFTLLLFPMTTSLFASMSQDALIIATSALAAGVVSRAVADARPMTTGAIAVAAAALSLAVMARPPYAPLALVLLAAPARSRAARWGALVVVFASMALWIAITCGAIQPTLQVPGGAADPRAQLRYIASHPFAVFPIAARTIARDFDPWVRQLIGTLGWLDLGLPRPYYGAAIGILVVSALAGTRGRERATRPQIAISLSAMALAAGAVLAIEYLTWTAVGARHIEGVQGRYFIPIAVFAAPLLLRLRGRAAPLASLAVILVAVFPVVSAIVTLRYIGLRYYGP